MHPCLKWDLDPYPAFRWQDILVKLIYSWYIFLTILAQYSLAILNIDTLSFHYEDEDRFFTLLMYTI